MADKKPNDKIWSLNMDEYILNYNKMEPGYRRDRYFKRYLYTNMYNLITYKLYSSKWSYIFQHLSVDDVVQDTIILMINNLDKYDLSKGRSFSYFSTVVYRNLININVKEEKVNSNIDSEVNQIYLDNIEDSEYLSKDSKNHFESYIEYCYKLFENDNIYINNQILYLDALDIIKRLPDASESLNKKSVQFLIRSNIGMSYNKYNQFVKIMKNIYKEYTLNK